MANHKQPVIPIKIYRFQFKPDKMARLPEYPGSAWRGAFGACAEKNRLRG